MDFVRCGGVMDFVHCGGVCALPAKSKFNIVGRFGEAGAWALKAASLSWCRASLSRSSFEVAVGDAGHSAISEFASVDGTRYCTIPPFVPLKARMRQSSCRRRRPSTPPM
jgi:hypothetical protein